MSFTTAISDLSLQCAYRPRFLCEIINLSPSEAEDYSIDGRAKILIKLQVAKELEVARADEALQLFNLNRHLRIIRALRIEVSELRELIRTSPITLDQALKITAVLDAIQ